MEKKISCRNGYTLMEILVGLAIMIIVSLIAIPAIGSLRNSLEITRYDDTARQVYLVAQNKLTTMKATGALEVFLEELETKYSGQKLKDAPHDFPAENNTWNRMYYLAGADEVFQNFIVGSNSVLLAAMETGGNFVVELNPETGDIYGVFYKEDAFSYEDIQQLESRGKDVRKKAMIGYYGGASEMSASSTLPGEILPTIEVINKEDLYLRIECEGLRKLAKTQQYMEMSIVITDESYEVDNPEAGGAYTLNLKGGTDFHILGDTLEKEILLDSIRGGEEGFESITKGALRPGDNLVITLSMTYAFDGVNIKGVANGNTNSLFAAKDTETGTLSVAYLRHLNNLRDSIYKEPVSNATITQMANINFDHTQWSDDVVIKTAVANKKAAEDFLAISNDKLLEGATFDGQNNQLLQFKISKSNTGTTYVGLFSKLNKTTLSNMKLVDFQVSGTQFVGALAGQTEACTISSCGAYLRTKDE